ncbi:DUF4376 domain-containing protein [Halomonas binhaiensis]|uniref:DUF4376 domain-containing protein n=1 Tax=Halomonas binhaiensis TaxID=2562282 RepID=A0A5C1NB85_9GAMM|nr:DUF4376 domain-containing protein [Halomonas binhaiensis]QEM80210.1 DUF4376 domain-containing protein [Halomonas binhaiensis]
MEYRNPRYNESGTIDCEIHHPSFGWIPFTASPNDAHEHCVAIYQAIIDSDNPIAPHEEPFDDVVKAKYREIETKLAEALAEGMPYTMPDGTEDIVQTRPEDEGNLLGLAIEARDLKAVGDLSHAFMLRAKSNRLYELTPDEMIDLTDTAKQFKQDLLERSWHLKDALRAAEEINDREAAKAINW